MGQDEWAKMNESWSRLSWLFGFVVNLSPSWLLAARALRPQRSSLTTQWFTITGPKAWASLIEPRSSTSSQTLTSSSSQSWRTRRWTSWDTCGPWRCTHIRETMISISCSKPFIRCIPAKRSTMCSSQTSPCKNPSWFWDLSSCNWGRVERESGWTWGSLPSKLQPLHNIFNGKNIFFGDFLLLFKKNVLGIGSHLPMPVWEQWWRHRTTEEHSLSAWQV